jgi:hypothetical protein
VANAFSLLVGRIAPEGANEQLRVLDFILGTHPISTKGTTELGRSEATKRF